MARGRSRPVHGAYNTRMISVRDGQAQILARIGAPLAPELLPLTRALARVLSDDFAAPFDVPPADNSAVDGYAVGSADIPARGTRDLVVIGDLAAGFVFEGKLGAGQALRIMTGAPMPAGADTVYPQEVVQRESDSIRVGPIDKGANVRLAGEDVRMGEVVIEAGSVLRPQEIGLMASLGAWQVSVRRRPRVALLSTGDEVAEPGTPRRPGQIYDANRFTLRGSIEQCGGEVIDLGIVPDVRDTLRASLEDAARAADVVVTSGGVSVGVYDLVKDVLQELGAIDFWQVAMQPGRPFAVGRIGSALFFGLPGNPVASLLSFLLFVRPALYKLAGRRRLFPETWQARALEPMRKKTGRTEYKRGILAFRDGDWEVCTTGPQGSGILSSMVAGNCFVVLEEARGDVKAGERVTVEPFEAP
ncbi:MAG: molybdopterin molybdenumtransferase MoeA [Candidatus Rokuibacteriota bacterium]|nr:MAG: molybdopterin molybdenumtransferase MoeA [Candidatus Rokubacteria bacterium]